MVRQKCSGIRRSYLDGLVAEQHHVDTFNIDATTKGSPYRARVVGSQELNSVDIEIVDGNGNVVCKYQSKYGADSNATNTQLNRGDYNDQQALVPEGQGADVVSTTGMTLIVLILPSKLVNRLCSVPVLRWVCREPESLQGAPGIA